MKFVVKEDDELKEMTGIVHAVIGSREAKRDNWIPATTKAVGKVLLIRTKDGRTIPKFKKACRSVQADELKSGLRKAGESAATQQG